MATRSPPRDGATPRELADAISQILAGKINAVSSSTATLLTLTANSATTVYTNPLIGPNSVLLLMPTTSNAAGALGGLYVSSRANGTLTITHANTATTDRTFGWALLGG